MKKRSICILVTVCLLVAFTSASFVTAATNGHSQTEAVTWATSQIGKGLEYDGIYEYQCVDLIKYYYDYLGNASFATGNANVYATNPLPSGWTRVYSNFQPGDVAVWKTDYTEYTPNGGVYYRTSSLGHVGIIVSAGTSSFDAVNQNFLGKAYCTLNTFSNSALQCAIRPDFTGGSVQTTMDWTEDICNPTETDAYISIKAVPSVSGSFGECGVTVMNTAGTVIGSKTETADASARTYLIIWYNIAEELGITLSPGASYSYQFYTYFNGTRYDSPVRSFTTPHTHAYSAQITPATCTAQGYTTHTCTICGDSYKDSYTSALGHNWDAGTVTVEPTETEPGVKTFTCTRCGETKTEPISATGHTHNYTATVIAPTCTERGYTIHACVCGDSYVADYVDALGHNFVGGVCTRCGAKDPNYVPPTPGDPCEGYTDIDRSKWYHSAADFVIARGLMGSTKTDNLTFEPNTKVSRAMVASILYRMANSPAVTYKGTFTDVKNGKWFTDAIEWCAQNGLASGKGNGKFDPNGNVTRQELAVFMMKMTQYLGKPTEGRADLGSFADGASVPKWASDYVKWAVSAGLISGKSSGGKTYLAPTDNATRAEFASIIMRFVQNIAEAK